jgi:hypothetical protein
MSSPTAADSKSSLENQWRAAVVEAERARQDYVAQLKEEQPDEAESSRLWQRLWLAERRRDELFRRLD